MYRSILYLRHDQGIPAAEFSTLAEARGIRVVDATLKTAREIDIARFDALILEGGAGAGEWFGALDRCQIIVNARAGAPPLLDLGKMRELGILVASVPDAGSRELGVRSAERALDLLERFGPARARRRRVGILGFGQVGRAAARRAAALGLDAWAYDPFADGEAFAHAHVRRAPSREELFGVCDAIVVALPRPGSPSDPILVGKESLELAPRGAVIVNFAAPMAVNLRPLADAMLSGRIAAAIVFAGSAQSDPSLGPLIDAGRWIVEEYYPRSSDRAVALDAARRALQIVLEAFDGVVPGHLLIDPPMPRLLTQPRAA